MMMGKVKKRKEILLKKEGKEKVKLKVIVEILKIVIIL